MAVWWSGGTFTSTDRKKLRGLPGVFVIAQTLLHQLNLGGKALSQHEQPSDAERLGFSHVCSPPVLVSSKVTASAAWPMDSSLLRRLFLHPKQDCKEFWTMDLDFLGLQVLRGRRQDCLRNYAVE